MIIYKITNLKTNKFYIGLTIQNINTRFNHHVYESKLGSTSYLHRSILKHGKENFKIEKLDKAQTIEELQNKEVFYINSLNTTNRKIGYNIAQGGSIQEYESISETARQNNINPKSLSSGLNNKRGFYTDRNKCVYKIK